MSRMPSPTSPNMKASIEQIAVTPFAIPTSFIPTGTVGLKYLLICFATAFLRRTPPIVVPVYVVAVNSSILNYSQGLALDRVAPAMQFR